MIFIDPNKLETMKLKTNINCMGCVSKVASFLDKQEGIISWKVDIENTNKPLTIESVGISEEEVKEALRKVGFEANTLN